MAEKEQDKVINHCPECKEAIDVTEQPPFAKILCPHCEKAVRVRTLLGNFQITSMLGEGGMSQVFLAEDVLLNREVALKILHRDLSQDDALMALFEREAQLTASINHPNVVKVYKAGSEQGYFFIAMELVEEVNLEELIAERGMLNEAEVLDIAHDVASGLRAAYNGGLIHRDIKPGNMLLTKDGTAKLVDFGLAVAHGTEDHVEDLWATPFYVPPEKLDGEPDDFRGDIYSLGATFFHALAGHPPFPANTASMEELIAIKAQPVALHDHAAHVSAMTSRLVDGMMAYKPEDRPQSYDDLLKLIEKEQDRQPDSAASKMRRKRALASKEAASANGPNWGLLVGIGIAVLAAAGVAIAVLNGGDTGKGQSLISGEDRVLSAGEKNVAARFNEARKMLLQGQFTAAGDAFTALLNSPDLKQPTLSLTRFNAGIAALLVGSEAREARIHFSSMAEANGFDRSKPGDQALATFFETAGSALSGSLPIMPASGASLKTDTVESAALLAYGLKNWNHGQFKSAISFFDAYEKATPSETWIKEYRALIAPYRADYAALSPLPNPRMSMSKEQLAAAKTALDAALKKMQTLGAAPQLVQNRAKRIEDLLKAKEQVAMAPMTGNRGATSPENTSTAPKPLTPEALAEKATLHESLLGMKELALSYHFDDAITQLNALSFKTEEVQEMQKNSIVGLQGAEAFMARLVEQLAQGSYEGVVRRKEGSPLDAKITRASREELGVDLGFGDNPLDVHLLAPDWLLEVAEKSWLTTQNSPPESAWQPWAEAAWFAGMTGQKDKAGDFAERILGIAPEFSAQWVGLKGL